MVIRKHYSRIYKQIKYCLRQPGFSWIDFFRLCQRNRYWLWHPQRWLKTVGITDTNGKTTVAHFLSQILRISGHTVGQLGTHNHYIRDLCLPSELTTPNSVTIHHLLSSMISENASHLVMEASSHGLAQDRLRDLTFAVAIFTNLSQDHLDYHENMEDYLSAKIRLFHLLRNDGLILVNTDDVRSETILRHAHRKLNRKVRTFGLSSLADLKAIGIKSTLSGTSFEAVAPDQSFAVEIQLPGRHNVSNALAALGAAQFLGLSNNMIQKGLKQTVVAGRFESVGNEAKPVIVDFAHSPKALECLLETARQFLQNRLICVASCNGDRDRSKRPLMGQIATSLSDHTILTSGSPRSERAEQILADMQIDLALNRSYQVIPDRRLAIEIALDIATGQDLVVVEGRGCDAFIENGPNEIPFDDRDVVRSCLIRQIRLRFDHYPSI